MHNQATSRQAQSHQAQNHQAQNDQAQNHQAQGSRSSRTAERPTERAAQGRQVDIHDIRALTATGAIPIPLPRPADRPESPAAG